ncbi:hypothetical protein [Streptomyces morookaense]|uniref:Uncharacterized protein n=1 Tax=Streptomyces morookaense TaxID=1970 RepID=A0A7Y7B8X2_STRMO|nr:hypothetical protein [Streptomyces morookaense]NVK81217.1 hypothetical protein [Streptomyces morookaense]GHF30471.1 hypothetical protein GCM10010359_35720 [Streptomyces morookaense]
MSSEELRGKIQLRKEERQAAALLGKFTGVQVLGFLNHKQVPNWVNRSLDNFKQMSSAPDSRIDDSADEQAIESWYQGFLDSAGISGRFFCSTDMTYFPWVECTAAGKGWVHSIRKTLGSDINFLSGNKMSLTVFFEEEYEYIGFRRTQWTHNSRLTGA